MVCVFVFVCLWGSTFAGLAFCATLSMTKLIIIIKNNNSTDGFRLFRNQARTCLRTARAWFKMFEFKKGSWDQQGRMYTRACALVNLLVNS